MCGKILSITGNEFFISQHDFETARSRVIEDIVIEKSVHQTG